MDKKVWVMIYDSEHGVDFVVATTELRVWQAAAAVCLEMLDDGEYEEADEFEAIQASCNSIVSAAIANGWDLTMEQCKAVIEACAPLSHGQFEFDERPVLDD